MCVLFVCLLLEQPSGNRWHYSCSCFAAGVNCAEMIGEDSLLSPPKRTPLYQVHVDLGARMVEFAGWLMPVQYTSIIEEHRAVRQAAGLFDICHMGHIRISGPAALESIQLLMTNDASKLSIGQAQYTLMCNEQGGVIDDLLVYRLPDTYLVVANASNAEKDFNWIARHCNGDVTVENVSEQYGMLALQGPQSSEILRPKTDVDLSRLPYYHSQHGHVAGIGALVSRTGYTGEDGFELTCKRDNVVTLWHELMKDALLKPRPCGLGARDTLRLEAKMALYGHELDETINPLEAGLGWVVRFDKPQFIGKDALAAIRDSGIERVLIGLEVMDRAIARTGFPIIIDGRETGRITSGSYSPTLNKNIALGFVPVGSSQPGTIVEVPVRRHLIKARIVPTPFYARSRPRQM